MEQLLIDVKYIVGNESNEDQRNIYRNKWVNVITNHLNNLVNIKELTSEFWEKKRKQENFFKELTDIIITRTDKGNVPIQITVEK